MNTTSTTPTAQNTTEAAATVLLTVREIDAMLAGLNGRDSALIDVTKAGVGPAMLDSVTAELRASRALADKLIAARRGIA